MLELSKVSRRVEEFKECGDLDMMTQYMKDVQSLQKKLAELVDTIGFINEVRTVTAGKTWQIKSLCDQHLVVSYSMCQ